MQQPGLAKYGAGFRVGFEQGQRALVLLNLDTEGEAHERLGRGVAALPLVGPGILEARLVVRATRRSGGKLENEGAASAGALRFGVDPTSTN